METSSLVGPPEYRGKCGNMQRFCFGLGHIFNDLCAAIWFSYMLFYFQIVLQMAPATAGTLIMIGQVVDSLATPAAGFVVDYTQGRKFWHLAGTIAVTVGFTLLFSLNPEQIHLSLLYYVSLVVVFQIGWAIVQISHLSVIPVIANDHAESVDLTAIRYTASVCCNIFVYIITWVILKTTNNVEIGPADFSKFKEIVIIVVLIGVLSSTIYYCGLSIKENYANNLLLENGSGGSNGLRVKSNDFNSKPHFLKSCVIYQVSIMYMSSRLFTTLSLIYIPLYLDEKISVLSQDGNGLRGAVASVPLVCFVSSFLTSLFLKYCAKVCNDKVVYMIGGLFSLAGCIWISQDISKNFYAQIDTIVVFIGIGGTATMVSSLCMTAEFVKCNGFRGASVYSTVTFTDKLISGAIVLIIQHLQCEPKELCPNFYRYVLAYACGSTAMLGLMSLCSLHYYIKSRR